MMNAWDALRAARRARGRYAEGEAAMAGVGVVALAYVRECTKAPFVPAENTMFAHSQVWNQYVDIALFGMYTQQLAPLWKEVLFVHHVCTQEPMHNPQWNAWLDAMRSEKVSARCLNMHAMSPFTTPSEVRDCLHTLHALACTPPVRLESITDTDFS